MNNSDRIGAGPDTKDLPRKGIFFVELRTHGVSGTPARGDSRRRCQGGAVCR